MLKVYGVGVVVAEPKLTKLDASNTSVCRLRLAFNEYIGSGENRKVESHYFDAVLWDSGAEAAAKLLKVGDKLFVDGILKENRFTDANGNDRSRAVIRIGTFTPVPKVAKEDKLV